MAFLLVAAAYQYHRSQNPTSGQDDNNNNNDDDIAFVRDQIQLISRTSSDLYRHAVIRCRGGHDDSSSAASMASGRRYESDETGRQGNEVVIPAEIAPTASPASSGGNSIVFRQDIREEWVDAVFGREFFTTPNFKPPLQGIGLSEIPSYVAYEATIPANMVKKGDRVGVTLSRIAIGLYVRQVAPSSEASLAGVKEGSVLISMNGMGMLGEPSRNALERLWQYEGHFEEPEDTSVSSNSQASHHSDKENASPPNVKGFLALTFIKNGERYTSMFMSNPPFGISWAPCGNFALVQRIHSFAAKHGVRRGCLVAAVNGRSLREIDHEGTAALIRDLFVGGEEIRLTLAYTPAGSRTGFFERSMMQDKKSKRASSPKAIEPRRIASHDGVQVRVHPVEYGMGSFFSCGSRIDESELRRGRQKPEEGSIAELASKVAAGEVEAPNGMNRRRSHPRHGGSSVSLSSITSPKNKVYAPCPVLVKEEILSSWDTLQALMFCLRCSQSSYDHETLERAVVDDAPPTDVFHDLISLMQTEDAWKSVKEFLLQFVSILCTFEADENDEIQVNREIAGLLLSLSRRNEEFSQRLYFLLRSYTAVMEGQRQSSKNAENNRSLLTLLQALDRLRSAQKKLTSQIRSDSPVIQSKSDTAAATSADPPSRNGSHNEVEAAGEADNANSPTPSASPPQESAAHATSIGSAKSNESTTKRRSIAKFFRRKPKTPEIKQSQKVPIPSPTPSNTDPTPTTPPTITKQPKGSNPGPRASSPLNNLSVQLECLSVPSLLENMSRFLSELDSICDGIERAMLKSFSQKIADWALQPWTARKGDALAKLTDGMREALGKISGDQNNKRLPLVNPIDSSEVLMALDQKECYILPSAHFPLLLTFNMQEKPDSLRNSCEDSFLGQEMLYRTFVELVSLRKSPSPNITGTEVDHSLPAKDCTYVVQGAVACAVKESGRSQPIDLTSKVHCWEQGSKLTFDSRSSWGPPMTLSLRLNSTAMDNGQVQPVHAEENSRLHCSSVVGYGWVDLGSMWQKLRQMRGTNGAKARFSTVSCHAQIWSLDETKAFDQHGDIVGGLIPLSEGLELELRVTTEILPFADESRGLHQRKRMLLYKHDDDLRQEMFAIQFIKTCDSLLKASGLDLKLLTFRCIPVGDKRGFIEWVPGSVPLSDICKPFAGSIIAGKDAVPGSMENQDENSISEVSKAGLAKYISLYDYSNSRKGGDRNSISNNPIQDFLRGVAYDPGSPYLVRKEIMDAYVKSCAGYCVVTYLLGVGDRHLDNLLLHQSGRFFHCDYSFILGNDPKKYLPVRMTEDMIFGMGGRESDNYAKFLSLAGAAYIALRRHENVRMVLSLVRLMAPSALPDVSVNQTPDEVLSAMRDRLRLDLPDDKAIAFIETTIEKSISSKMWLAVDAIHTLGKRF